MTVSVCSITDPDLHAQDSQDESDDLGAAQGIFLAVLLSLPVWAVSAWLVL